MSRLEKVFLALGLAALFLSIRFEVAGFHQNSAIAWAIGTFALWMFIYRK